ncbi:hypothetical protein [Streptomyces broussonetiae]|uniref:Uncharacterized protein n=1 Tax=Streptomyces broussonetiae TaxID=2686304 RepID=A0ABV5E5P6_9ACTN
MLRQEVGHRAALKVTADAAPLQLIEALSLVERNRLAWCLVQLRSGDVDLRWRCRTRRPCGHEVVIEHRCPAQDREFVRRPEGALW